ncbi:MAG: metallophosphoesterase [Bacteroidales bacterium]|nr:metallophosphoesterase [Bacteroidales bacterium]
MKIQFCSDLHLEFPENQYFLEKNPVRPEGDILIMCGDILPLRFKNKSRYASFFDKLSQGFETVYWVPGNHEFYYSDIAAYNFEMHEAFRENIFIVNNLALTNKDVRFIFSTLWTNIDIYRASIIEQRLSDFKAINYGGDLLKSDQYNSLHTRCLDFLVSELEDTDYKTTIVATHHVPTYRSYPERFKNDILNPAFAVDLDSMIENSDIDSWLYGHHHYNPDEFSIASTRMRCNQLGYLAYNEKKNYRNNAFIEV